jgi:hypothetical protein
MARMIRFSLFPVLLLSFALCASAEPGFQSITLTFSETWTGNAFTPPDYAISGSEVFPIDTSIGGGARFNLVDPFLFASGALTVDPRLTLGTRYYLLYQSGWVVPTQDETALGEDENLQAGYGSARVLTVSIAAPVGMEFGLGERAALTVGLSPTLVFRLRAGDAIALDGDKSNLNGMYPFFYGRLRWLRPELHLAGRFDVSEYLAFTIRATSSISILDMADPTFPWWDQFQAAGTLEFSLTPPLSGLFRTEEKPVAAPQPVSPDTDPASGAENPSGS